MSQAEPKNSRPFTCFMHHKHQGQDLTWPRSAFKSHIINRDPMSPFSPSAPLKIRRLFNRGALVGLLFVFYSPCSSCPSWWNSIFYPFTRSTRTPGPWDPLILFVCVLGGLLFVFYSPCPSWFILFFVLFLIPSLEPLSKIQLSCAGDP
jgi:hypothetical protein